MDNDSESALVQSDIASFEAGEGVPNRNTILTCPECGGVLWHLDEDKLVRYRCHVGHTFSEESLLVEQSNAVESALWAAVRVLEEKAALTSRMAAKAKKDSFSRSARRFSDQAENAERSADIIRELILSGKAIASLENLPEEEIEAPPVDKAEEESLEPTDQYIEDT
jgi:two-component system chemotaxis response regulator CheB